MPRYREPYVLFKDKSTGYWKFWYYDGDIRRKRSTGQQTKPGAKAFAESFVASQRGSGTLNGFAKDFFLPDLCDWVAMERRRYRENYKRQGRDLPSWEKKEGISDAVLRNKRGYLVNHILPAWGDRQLSKLQPDELEDWLYGLDLANSTRGHIYTAFNNILKHAVRRGKTETNPLSQVHRPVPHSRKRNIFSEEELKRLFAAAYQANPQRLAAFYTLYITGMRSGELRSIRPIDVLFDRGAIVVRRGKKDDESIGRTKTDTSYRVVLVDGTALSLLSQVIAQRRVDQNALIFPQTRKTFMNWMNDAISKAGIDPDGRVLVVHSLRYCFNSYMRDKVPGEILRKFTGHSHEAMSNHYDARWVEERIQGLEGVRGTLPSLELSHITEVNTNAAIANPMMINPGGMTTSKNQ